MKRKSKIFLFCLSFFIIFCFILNYKKSSKESIREIFDEDAYSYLSPVVLEYIEDAYDETGEVILTEKNKKENEPYLNPLYIKYLEMSDEEKENVLYVPDKYIVDFNPSISYSSNANLPTKYDLRNVDGKSYISSIKDQGDTEICWAFAAVENVETLLMKQNKKMYDFSIRQLDYASNNSNSLVMDADWSSCSGNCTYTPYSNIDNGSRMLGSGANFYTSSIIMSNALGLTDESVLPWTEDNNPLYAHDVIGTDKSLYEVDSSIILPTINSFYPSSDVVNGFVSKVKNYILEYGGPFVGTFSPMSTCGFENKDGSIVLKTDDCINNPYNKNLGHSMQIIGWDDDFTYSYCESGTSHLSLENGACSSGDLVEGKGAWIVRNSWGDNPEEGGEYKYIYLTYDSTNVSIGFTTSISSMSDRSWDNNYHSNPWVNQELSKGMSSTSSQEKSFNTHNINDEKIEKIKLFTSSVNGTYDISISSGDRVYNDIAVLNSGEVGIYTVDLSDKNVLVGDSYTVSVTGRGVSKFYKDSISVFTSNVSDDMYAVVYSDKAYDSSRPLSHDNPLYVNGGDAYNVSFKSYLENIPQNSNLTYRFSRDDRTVYGDQIIDSHTITVPEYNNFSILGSKSRFTNAFSYNAEIGNTWVIDVLYDDLVISSFPIKFNTSDKSTSSNVRLYSNNGSDYFIDEKFSDLYDVTLNDVSDLNNANFYNNGLYITGWNTEPDGSGVNYGVDDKISIYRDMNLYAQWSTDKLNISIVFDCNTRDDCNKTDDFNEKVDYSLGDSFVMPINDYIRDGYVFSYWTIGIGNSLYEGETYDLSRYIGYPVYNNTEINVKANWIEEANSYTVSFDSNGGSGEMLSVKAEKNSSVLINNNLFVNDGFIFSGWNTEPDGSGIMYSSGGYIKSDNDVILYAQWRVNSSNRIKLNTPIDNLNLGYDSSYDIKVFKGDGSLKTSGFVGTGDEIKIYQNGTLVNSYYASVKGDINGDGQLKLKDLLTVKNYILKFGDVRNEFDNAEYLFNAGDYSGDGKISLKDFAQMKIDFLSH